MKYERLTNSKTAKSMRDNRNTSNPYYVRLAEIEDKIENETLVELPCKVGDKVFDITDRPEIWEVEVKGFLIDEKGIWFNFGLYQKRVGLLGIKIFLTKDEAEKRLEKLRGELEN